MYILENIKDGLGNRIYCIINILYEAILNEDQINLEQLNNKQTGKLQYKYDKILDIKKIQDNFNKEFIKKNKNKNNTFFPRNLHRINKREIDVSKYFTICNKYIKPFLNQNILKPLDSKICLLHIRSGDQFNKKSKSHPIYVLPPLSYYIKIINEFNDKYDRFIIMTEPDLLNPCISKLKEYSNKVEILTNSPEEDYIYFLRAESIVLSFSTFSDTTVYLSPNLKNLYFWNYQHVFSDKTVIPKNINLYSLILTKPYIERGNWDSHNDKNIKLMIDYKLDDVIFENI